MPAPILEIPLQTIDFTFSILLSQSFLPICQLTLHVTHSSLLNLNLIRLLPTIGLQRLPRLKLSLPLPDLPLPNIKIRLLRKGRFPPLRRSYYTSAIPFPHPQTKKNSPLSSSFTNSQLGPCGPSTHRLSSLSKISIFEYSSSERISPKYMLPRELTRKSIHLARSAGGIVLWEWAIPSLNAIRAVEGENIWVWSCV